MPLFRPATKNVVLSASVLIEGSTSVGSKAKPDFEDKSEKNKRVSR
jgi:hypothetical protein